MSTPALKFVYRNYKGEIEERVVEPEQHMVYLSPREDAQFHPKGGWAISGICRARKARRIFALTQIIGPITEVD